MPAAPSSGWIAWTAGHPSYLSKSKKKTWIIVKHALRIGLFAEKGWQVFQPPSPSHDAEA